MSRKKFKVYYPQDHEDRSKAGRRIKFKDKKFIVMSEGGVFFVVDESDFYTYVTKLSDEVGKYNVIWEE